MDTKKIPARHARRGGTLVIGLTNLQESFEAMHKGGCVVLTSFGKEITAGVTEVILVSEDRLNEVLHEAQDLDRSKLN